MEAVEIVKENDTTPRSPLEDFVSFENVDSLDNIDSQMEKFTEVERIQGFEKMYQFVNEDITYETLNQYADECLRYIVPDFSEYRKLTTKINEIKSKPMFITDDEIDFI